MFQALDSCTDHGLTGVQDGSVTRGWNGSVMTATGEGITQPPSQPSNSHTWQGRKGKQHPRTFQHPRRERPPNRCSVCVPRMKNRHSTAWSPAPLSHHNFQDGFGHCSGKGGRGSDSGLWGTLTTAGQEQDPFCLTARMVATSNKKQRNSSLDKQPALNGPGKFPTLKETAKVIRLQ